MKKLSHIKIISVLCSIAILISIFPMKGFTVNDDVIYISLWGEGDGSSPQNPMSDMDTAFNQINDGGKIVIMDTYTSTATEITPQKSITIEGYTSNVIWVLRGGMNMKGDVKLNNLKIQTTCTDADQRFICMNGNNLEFTESVEVLTADTYNQTPYIDTGNTTQRSRLTLNGGDINEIHATGSMGVDIVIGGNATALVVCGEDKDYPTTLTINSSQTFKNSINNIDTIVMNAGNVLSYSLENVNNLNMVGGVLELYSTKQVHLYGDLQANGGILYLQSDLIADGRITGHNMKLGNGFMGSIISNDETSDAYLSFVSGNPYWEISEKTENGKKIWYVSAINNTATYYLDGTAGNDEADGLTRDTALRTMKKMYQKIDEVGLTKELVQIVICGDTVIDEELTPPNATVEISGFGYDATLYVKANLSFTGITILSNLNMEFDADKSIFSEGNYLTLGYNLNVEGVPDVYFNYKDDSNLNQVDIFSGSFGNVNSVDNFTNKAVNNNGLLTIFGGEFESINGWECVFFENETENQQINLKNDCNIGSLEVNDLKNPVILAGNLNVEDYVDFYFNDTVILLNSGKKITSNSIYTTYDVGITIVETDNIDEGDYIISSEPLLEASFILKDMPEYFVFVKSADEKKYTLKNEYVPIETISPTIEPTPVVTLLPTIEPTPIVTQSPTAEPTPEVTQSPTIEPTPEVTPLPTIEPIPVVTPLPKQDYEIKISDNGQEGIIINIENNTSKESAAAMIIAEYKDGIPVNVKYENIEIKVDKAYQKTYHIEQNSNNVKIFLWDDIKSMKPLCESKLKSREI